VSSRRTAVNLRLASPRLRLGATRCPCRRQRRASSPPMPRRQRRHLPWRVHRCSRSRQRRRRRPTRLPERRRLTWLPERRRLTWLPERRRSPRRPKRPPTRLWPLLVRQSAPQPRARGHGSAASHPAARPYRRCGSGNSRRVGRTGPACCLRGGCPRSAAGGPVRPEQAGGSWSRRGWSVPYSAVARWAVSRLWRPSTGTGRGTATAVRWSSAATAGSTGTGPVTVRSADDNRCDRVVQAQYR